MYIISDREQQQIDELLSYLMNKFSSAEDENFIKNSIIYSHDLPDGIKQYLYAYHARQSHPGLAVIKGFKSFSDMPPTPKTWFYEDSYPPNFRTDYLSILCTSILGEPFGFETQQKAKLIHDVLPIKGREHNQEGCSSLQSLNFHTEDAFHPQRADYLCLACLKNPTSVGTLVCLVRDLCIPDDIRKVLHEKRFYQLSDNTHSESVAVPTLESVLFGDQHNPYLRVDYDFTKPGNHDSEAENALAYLLGEIEKNIYEVEIAPGDILIIDNYKVVHGRRSFSAQFDGNDRWLRRLNIKADLKEASNYRRHPTSRMLSFKPIF